MHHLPVPDPDPGYDANPVEPKGPTNVAAEGVDANDSSEDDEDPKEGPNYDPR